MKGDFSVSDEFMETASKFNIWVFLDFHKIWNDQQQPTPESNISLDQFIDAWKIVLYRYLNFNISMNIYNEYQGEDVEYLKNYSTRVMTAIEQEFPGRNLTYALTGYRWSGSLHRFNLENLPWSDKIRYSVHKYWFSTPPDFNGDYEKDWDWSFGDLPISNKVIVGEFGWKQEDPNQIAWAKRFIAYLKKKNIRDSGFWTLAISGDTNGIFKDDCETFDLEKFAVLKTLWEDDRRNLRGNKTLSYAGDDCVIICGDEYD